MCAYWEWTSRWKTQIQNEDFAPHNFAAHGLVSRSSGRMWRIFDCDSDYPWRKDKCGGCDRSTVRVCAAGRIRLPGEKHMHSAWVFPRARCEASSQRTRILSLVLERRIDAKMFLVIFSLIQQKMHIFQLTRKTSCVLSERQQNNHVWGPRGNKPQTLIASLDTADLNLEKKYMYVSWMPKTNLLPFIAATLKLS